VWRRSLWLAWEKNTKPRRCAVCCPTVPLFWGRFDVGRQRARIGHQTQLSLWVNGGRGDERCSEGDSTRASYLRTSSIHHARPRTSTDGMAVVDRCANSPNYSSCHMWCPLTPLLVVSHLSLSFHTFPGPLTPFLVLSHLSFSPATAPSRSISRPVFESRATLCSSLRTLSRPGTLSL